MVAACSTAAEQEDVPTANGGGAAGPSASAPPGTGDPQKFAQCIRDHGVPDFPDPGPDGRFTGGGIQGLDRGALTKALEACQDLAPAQLSQATGKMTGEQLEKWSRYAKCMREAGFDVPDPDPNGSLLDWTRTWIQSLNTGDGRFQQASEGCQQQAGINLGGAR